ncbi:MAG: stage III sporulation protein AG [Anaerocolumna aminovalerica]|uniref:stage III sporulation protein AG n=1 Tax=Anaerocolumna aminovalerica TaxID=1527 RepID=UPI0029131744|nr:stage III sporulation protein AG [Anaerocolumna aminovalerica]MDU6265062.1 stage III sporulation protein AG [Anaerocolumna aminovalerica]
MDKIKNKESDHEKDIGKENGKKIAGKKFIIKPANLVMLLIAGVLLLLTSFPNLFSSKSLQNEKNTPEKTTQTTRSSSDIKEDDETEAYSDDLEKKLKKFLSNVAGIGKVEVMVTLKGSKERIVLKDSPYTQESMNEVDGEGGNRVSSSVKNDESTVMVGSGSGENLPYVIQELEPEVEGIAVIAEGGDNPEIIAEIIEAVQVLFNVPAHKVKVMKMN